MKRGAMRIGVLSDTHGRLDQKVFQIFAGVDRIIHAGDIGSEIVLETLKTIAPVTAVRGNNDAGAPLEALPDLERIDLNGLEIVLIHNLKEYLKPPDALKERLRGARPDLVISGHSHKGMIEQKEGIVFFNPGGAGPKRFSLRRSVGLMEWQDESLRISLVFLEEGRPLRRTFPLHAQRPLPEAKNQSPLPRR